MKTDYYLNQCLEEAEKSPLVHRHGCIVVKGGKVIGKGFNDYRPGYDGGNLKTGALPTKVSTFDTKKQEVVAKKTRDGFRPFEKTGHKHAYSPLTMHSEMMAINSALESSSTLAATTLSHFKPPIEPSRDSKNKRQQRRDALNAYAQKGEFQAGASRPKQAHQTQGQHHHQIQHHHHHGHRDRYTRKDYCNTAKHQQQQQHLKQKSHLNMDDQSSDAPIEIQHVDKPLRKNKLAQHSLPLPDKDGGNPFTEKMKDNKIGINGNPIATSRSGLQRSKHVEFLPESHSLRDRMKHRKVRGVDVYIVRIGAAQERTYKRKKESKKSSMADDTLNGVAPPYTASAAATAPPRSLHDELTCKEPKPKLSEVDGTGETNKLVSLSSIRESRPCYRCILYMHSAGIKRVHWTNEEGDWRSAKVRDLYDQLSGSTTCNGQEGADGVFVTKHEILLLRRLLEQKGS
ncbi:hypothetical protein F4778DRAFT_787333 [Xylariomycetidae sp. FL2044]|nr:hypothetical protein F4778DRAFT_787333 [Xylariomycetidae sp. FL2044]